MRTRQTNADLRRSQIEHDLPHLHRERWNRIAAELADQIAGEIGEQRAAIERKLEQHYALRFRPESSRDALLAEAGADPAR